MMARGSKRRRLGGLGLASVVVASLAVGGAVVAGLNAGAQSSVQPASGPVADWRLVWNDEFNGTSLDATKWGTCFPADRWTPDNCTIDGGGNSADHEAATSQGAKVEVSGGVLRLWAEKSPQTSSITGNTYQFRSAMVQARRALSASNPSIPVWETSPVADESAWTHVYVETRIKIPYGVGLWPSFWLMPADSRLGPWPYSGELDGMEYLPDSLTQGPNGDAKFVQNLVWHGKVRGSDCTYPGNYYFVMCPNRVDAAGPTPWTDFHTFGVDKSPSGIGFYIDGKMVRFQARWPTTQLSSAPLDQDLYPFDQPFFPILRLAVGRPPDYLVPDTSTWPVQSPVPAASMDVDYVRVYQRLTTWGSGSTPVSVPPGPRRTVPPAASVATVAGVTPATRAVAPGAGSAPSGSAANAAVPASGAALGAPAARGSASS